MGLWMLAPCWGILYRLHYHNGMWKCEGKQQGKDRSLMPPRAISTLWLRSVCAHKVFDAKPVATRVTHKS